jgi:hypothetical protein
MSDSKLPTRFVKVLFRSEPPRGTTRNRTEERLENSRPSRRDHQYFQNWRSYKEWTMKSKARGMKKLGVDQRANPVRNFVPPAVIDTSRPTSQRRPVVLRRNANA